MEDVCGGPCTDAWLLRTLSEGNMRRAEGDDMMWMSAVTPKVVSDAFCAKDGGKFCIDILTEDDSPFAEMEEGLTTEGLQVSAGQRPRGRAGRCVGCGPSHTRAREGMAGARTGRSDAPRAWGAVHLWGRWPVLAGVFNLGPLVGHWR